MLAACATLSSHGSHVCTHPLWINCPHSSTLWRCFAQEKDRQRFGDAFGERYCVVQLISRAEFEEELLRFQRQKDAVSGGASSRSGGTLDATSPPATAAASLASLPLSGSGHGSAGMLPTAAAAAAGFMGSGLPPMPGGMMLPPGYMLPTGVAPVPGGWPVAPPGMAPGAQVHPFMMPPLPGLAGMPGLPWNGMAVPWTGNTAAARYMVQVGGQHMSRAGPCPPAAVSCCQRGRASIDTWKRMSAAWVAPHLVLLASCLSNLGRT